MAGAPTLVNRDARWAILYDLKARGQATPGVLVLDVVRECEGLVAGETDLSWRTRWRLALATAQFSGDDQRSCDRTSVVLLEDAARSGSQALLCLAHALRACAVAADHVLDVAVNQVGRAVAIADEADRTDDVEDWSAALILIGNAFLALDLFELADRWYAQQAELPAERVAPVESYAGAWNLCEVGGRLALAAVRRPPFEPVEHLFALVAERGRVVDRLALAYGFEEPAWGALWVAVAEAFVGDPDAALEQLGDLAHLADDVSLVRSAGDVWRVARLRAMLRLGRAGEALAWDDVLAARTDEVGASGPVHAEELGWERLLAATADAPAARDAVCHYATSVERRSVLGSALATDQLVARIAQLAGERERRQLAEDAARDPLTGVLNRRGFLGSLERAASSPRDSYALFIVDVDQFKQINDDHTHAAGDDVLRHVAAVLTASARSDDLVARLGGDEFALIAPVDSVAAERLGRRLVRAVQVATSEPLDVTVSIGAAVRSGPVDLARWMDAADRAMFTAKRLAPGSVEVVEVVEVVEIDGPRPYGDAGRAPVGAEIEEIEGGAVLT